MEAGDDQVEDWERSKVAQRRVEEIRNMVDLERGLAMTPSRKRREEDHWSQPGTEEKERKQRKLLHPVLKDDWGEAEPSKDDLGGGKEQRFRKRSRMKNKDDLVTPGRDNLPLSGTGISTNTTVEDPKDDTPVEEIILPSQHTPLRDGAGNNGALKMVPPSRDELKVLRTINTTHKQTSIANYFASVGGVP